MSQNSASDCASSASRGVANAVDRIVCPIIEVGVNADTINEEEDTAGTLKGDLLRAIVELRFAPKPLCVISADDRAIFLQTILPSQYLPAKYDSTLERIVNKKMEMEELTAARARGRNTPSRHRIGSGMVWRHVQFRCPPPEAQLPPTDSDTPREANIKGMWQLLKSVLREPYAEKAAWTHDQVKQWTRNANDASAPAVAKKGASSNIPQSSSQFNPPSVTSLVWPVC